MRLAAIYMIGQPLSLCALATFPIYWDYSTRTDIPTTALASRHAGESIHSFSTAALGAGRIVVNDTHATFPLVAKLLQAGTTAPKCLALGLSPGATARRQLAPAFLSEQLG